METRNLEEFLLENGFILETYYHTNKRYVKEINEFNNLYVRIFSDINEIVDVEYESMYPERYGNYDTVSFETITTLKQLEYLIKAFTNETI